MCIIYIINVYIEGASDLVIQNQTSWNKRKCDNSSSLVFGGYDSNGL